MYDKATCESSCSDHAGTEMKVADVHAINMDRLCQDVQADVVARISGSVGDSERVPPKAVQDEIWKERVLAQPMQLEDDGLPEYHVQQQ